MCVHRAFPLVPTPGAQIFLADQDLSSEPDADGNRVISCTPVSTERELRLFRQGISILKWLAR